MTDVRAPLTPADCDLTDFGFMPLEVARLRDSKIVDEVTGDEFRAAVLLWCASWHQVPAGSLPDDDLQLAKFAGYGRVVREWMKVKNGALYGFEKCSDGRLYHSVICEKALESWAGKVKHHAQKAADRERKRSKLPPEAPELSAGKSAKSPERSAGIPTENALKGQGQGQGDIPFSRENGQAKPAAPKVAKPDPWKAVYDRGKEVLGSEAGGQITKLRKLYDNKPVKVLAKIEDAAEQREPSKWLAGYLWSVNDGGKLAGEYVGGIPP